VHRELTDVDIAHIADTYHAWRGDPSAGGYIDVPGYCKAAVLDDIHKRDYILTPGRYVDAEVAEEDDELFDEKMRRLTANLREQYAESARLEQKIEENLKQLGYGGEQG
jgi:type I restriction enzyme M protein